MRKPATKAKPAPKTASAFVASQRRIPVWLLAILLVLVTIALYWPAMRFGFINLDDPNYVTDNPHVQGGLNWAGVGWAFGNTAQAAYWAPLTWLAHMMACQLFGLNPWGHHLINVLLHAASTALVFLVFRQMTGAMWRSLMLAALFGWHPLRVESVAWVAELKDTLSTLFWMLTLWAYVNYARRRSIPNSQPSILHYSLALLFFALGLMSKGMLVTLPFVLLLLDYWPLRRFKPGCLWQLVMEKIPFFALSAAASVVTFVVQKQGGAVVGVETLPLEARVGNALVSYCRYLGKMFWPSDLAVYYPHPGHWPLAEVLLAGVFLCGITLLLFVERRRYPFLLVGWLWFAGTLVPVIQLVQSGGQAMADRFTYVPSLGVLILIIWGAYELVGRWKYHAIVLSLAGSAAIVLCLGLTRQQLGYWKDGETLFRHSLAVTKNNSFTDNSLGLALFDKGQTLEAINQYQEAIHLKPDYAEARNNLGAALLNEGQIDEATGQLQEAIRLKPGDAEAHYNLGTALVKKGQTLEAISQFQEAIRLKPDFAEAHYNLGIVFAGKDQIDEAMSQFQEAIRLKPDYAEARNNLGAAFLDKGQIDEAINQLREAVRLKPDDANAQRNLAKALELKGRSSAR